MHRKPSGLRRDAAIRRTVLFNQMIAGDTYLNIHTTVVPTGEIQGFLAEVPELASFMLLASGFVGFWFPSQLAEEPGRVNFVIRLTLFARTSI